MRLGNHSTNYVDLDLIRKYILRYYPDRPCHQCNSLVGRRFISKVSARNSRHFYCIECALTLNITTKEEITDAIRNFLLKEQNRKPFLNDGKEKRNDRIALQSLASKWDSERFQGPEIISTKGF